MQADIVVVPADSSDLAQMVKELDEDLLERYPAEEIFGLDFSDPKVKEVLFAVAYREGKAVGCGGIRPLDRERTELKRFFVRKSVRGTGIAARLLAFLEQQALHQGYDRIVLETGTLQPEAIRFYEKNGYTSIPCYGEYIDSEYSLCFEKQLG